MAFTIFYSLFNYHNLCENILSFILKYRLNVHVSDKKFRNYLFVYNHKQTKYFSNITIVSLMIGDQKQHRLVSISIGNRKDKHRKIAWKFSGCNKFLLNLNPATNRFVNKVDNVYKWTVILLSFTSSSWIYFTFYISIAELIINFIIINKKINLIIHILI